MSAQVAPHAPKLVVVSGPTAVGKTWAGIELALRFDGEVINADSRYLYRGLEIGVAKPDMTERRGVPHHLIDVIAPDDEMSLANYQKMAYQAIGRVVARGRLPLLVGGTPLYVNAVLEGWRIPNVPPDWAFRSAMEASIAEEGVTALSARLAAVDPVAAERCGVNPRRIIRALEVFHLTGVPMTRQEGRGPRPYRTLELGLTMPREHLYTAINRRVDDQIARGLVEEVRLLVESGLTANAPAMTSLGYRQLLPYLAGEIALSDAVRQIKHDTHRYVRHQQTWLRRNRRLIPIDVTMPNWIDGAAERVRLFLGSD